ncbi:TIGR03767 family metallophosphoesterase [Flexivirga sp. ID2601S]|uniref:TIGR03767 family metallophosphoesterase n=1 Tax=Flexivirga aerilata TaxID=1656889 RepID=A0A849AGB8_9MICO|nr:TIGR03767 family metallophosphoesterase [Flexivirga aerilata]NNG38933.1 TIGR03767 family metallophosphoesterase [Flexivirga aerilata]
MPEISRRSLLIAGAGAAGAGVLGWGAPGTARAADTGARRAYSVRGTTLEQVATPVKTSGYSRLAAGPGYPLVVRTDLAAGTARRDDTRVALASFVQLTDLHVIDAQSPMRFEFLRTATGSAFRPHEALGTQGTSQLVRRINDIGRGPFSGRVFDCVVSTGDNTDNHETVELDWFLTLLNGGTVTPNTGDPKRWEGAQTSGNSFYYNPQDPAKDDYKDAGFPYLPGYFARATAAHTSPGLHTKWFSVFGNHDDSVEGTLPSDWGLLKAVYTGDFKFTGFSSGGADSALRAAVQGGATAILGMSSALRTGTKVTPDQRRKPFTPKEYMQAHLAAGATGAGPVGHGFTAENVATGNGYYTFEIAPGVTGIALDSTNRAGFTDGSLGHQQYTWLIDVLERGSSHYYDSFGRKVTKAGVQDSYFVVFSHHTSDSMGNLLIAPDRLEIRHSGPDVRGVLSRFPNVLAWVNGHTHDNRITARGHAVPERSWWEINTASHIDFPQHARIIDVCDNRDGTISLFTTLVESAAPYQASYGAGDAASLASLYREFSYNDLAMDPQRTGGAGDHNTELLLTKPGS